MVVESFSCLLRVDLIVDYSVSILRHAMKWKVTHTDFTQSADSSVFFCCVFFVPFRCSLLHLGIPSLSLAYFVTDCSNEKCCEKSYTHVIYFLKGNDERINGKFW